jgi:putative ABC transport system permease protein
VVVRPLGSDQPTIPAPAAERLAHLPGVVTTLPEVDLGVDVLVPGTLSSTRNLTGFGELLRGANWGGSALDSVPLVAGRIPAPGANELVMPTRVVQLLGAHLGQRLLVRYHGAAPQAFNLVGMAGGGGAELLDSGATSFTSLAPALVLGGSHGLSQVQVELARGVDPKRWVVANSVDLGPSLQASVASNTFNFAAGGIKLVSGALSGVAAIALFVGMFLIYLTMSTRVLERTRMFGLLYAMGTTRRQIRRTVLGEAVGIGLVGSAIGVVVGLIIGVGLVLMTPNMVGAVPTKVVVPLVAIPTSVLAGLLMVVLGALAPARRAARLSPVEALKADHEPPRSASKWWIAGAALMALAIASRATAGTHPNVLFLAVTSSLLGAVLVVPALLPAVAAVVGWLTRRLSPVVGSIAVLHLSKERNRSAYTLSLVMVVMAMGLAVSSGVRSVADVLQRESDAQLRADVRIFGVEQPADLAAVRSSPGISAATAFFRAPPGDYLAARPDATTSMEVIDPSTYFRTNGFAFTAGTSTGAEKALAAGTGVLVPTYVAAALHLTVGSPIILRTQAGPHRFSVSGVYIDMINSPGLVLSYPEAQTYYGTSGISEVDATIAPGAKLASVMKTLEPTVAKRDGLFGWQPMDRLRALVKQNVDAISRMLSAILAVAAGIGFLGLANTLVMSVITRTREIGLLQALGTDRRGVGLMVLTETSVLCGSAFALALALGELLNYVIGSSSQSVMQVPAATHYPWGFVPVIAVLSVIAAVTASVPPLRRSLRLAPSLALRVD